MRPLYICILAGMVTTAITGSFFPYTFAGIGSAVVCGFLAMFAMALYLDHKQT